MLATKRANTTPAAVPCCLFSEGNRNTRCKSRSPLKARHADHSVGRIRRRRGEVAFLVEVAKGQRAEECAETSKRSEERERISAKVKTKEKWLARQSERYCLDWLRLAATRLDARAPVDRESRAKIESALRLCRSQARHCLRVSLRART